MMGDEATKRCNAFGKQYLNSGFSKKETANIDDDDDDRHFAFVAPLVGAFGRCRLSRRSARAQLWRLVRAGNPDFAALGRPFVIPPAAAHEQCLNIERLLF
jgi:hypothetical protein